MVRSYGPGHRIEETMTATQLKRMLKVCATVIPVDRPNAALSHDQVARIYTSGLLSQQSAWLTEGKRFR